MKLKKLVLWPVGVASLMWALHTGRLSFIKIENEERMVKYDR